jgi:hypothetical protein
LALTLFVLALALEVRSRLLGRGRFSSTVRSLLRGAFLVHTGRRLVRLDGVLMLALGCLLALFGVALRVRDGFVGWRPVPDAPAGDFAGALPILGCSSRRLLGALASALGGLVVIHASRCTPCTAGES